MKIIWAIIIASLSVPALVFILFLGIGLVFLGAELFGGEYSNGWLGMVYAGATYAYIGGLASTIPTVVLGLPISLIAKKYGVLHSKVILAGAAITGGVFLGVAATLSFEEASVQLFLWSMVAGMFGGLLNGYVFLKVLKSNKPFKCAPSGPDALKRAA